MACVYSAASDLKVDAGLYFAVKPEGEIKTLPLLNVVCKSNLSTQKMGRVGRDGTGRRRNLHCCGLDCLSSKSTTQSTKKKETQPSTSPRIKPIPLSTRRKYTTDWIWKSGRFFFKDQLINWHFIYLYFNSFQKQ